MSPKKIKTEGYEGLYLIYPNGDCFSLRKGRYLKPIISSNHVMYCLSPHKGVSQWFMADRLVAEHFLPEEKDPDKKEIHHKDYNSLNNVHTNLEWVTHSFNITKSFQKDYVEAKKSRTFMPPLELINRITSANAKVKPIAAINRSTSDITRYPSVKVLCEDLGMNRRTFNRHMNAQSNKTYIFEYIKE